MELSRRQSQVVGDLLEALDDEELHDVSLIGIDSIEVPSCRFLLAARSPVFKRMLYGKFREAGSKQIELQYTGRVLHAIVRYCTHNLLAPTLQDAHSLRFLVQLHKAADFLELPGLVQETESLVKQTVSKQPWLACPVLDEADESSCLSQFAMRMIRCRPYVSLAGNDNASSAAESGTEGGIECIQKSDIIVKLMKDTEIEAGELFLFEMLKRWVDHVDGSQQVEAKQVAKECGNYFQLQFIEPSDLLGNVKKSGLFPSNLIVEAICRQALTASQNRVWTTSCRGSPSYATQDRVLVEGCGHPDVNGVYHRIKGLYKGDVYSKHEVACGQLLVYTLSCSQKHGQVESRIFCSKVLTHKAVPCLLSKPSVGAPIFQPLLQVISLEPPTVQAGSSQRASPLAKLYKVQLSDGDHFIPGTFAEEMSSVIAEQYITENSLIKILAYNPYQFEGQQSIHILEASVVSAHPGHTLGSPVPLTRQDVVSAAGNSSSNSKNCNDDDADNGLQKLYSCYYPVTEQALDYSKIPQTGWNLEEHGVSPPPRCTWIPATTRKFGDVSRSNSQEEAVEG